MNYEVYSYWNILELQGVFNAVAAQSQAMGRNPAAVGRRGRAGEERSNAAAEDVRRSPR
ncbi:MAG: hypothetical protein N2690_13270 [Rhodocyclaceae bacterium]|nr:hypothetical protein [Rhodocyclaceae bacterium]